MNIEASEKKYQHIIWEIESCNHLKKGPVSSLGDLKFPFRKGGCSHTEVEFPPSLIPGVIDKLIEFNIERLCQAKNDLLGVHGDRMREICQEVAQIKGDPQ